MTANGFGLGEVRGFEKQMFGAISLPSARILANGLLAAAILLFKLSCLNVDNFN